MQYILYVAQCFLRGRYFEGKSKTKQDFFRENCKCNFNISYCYVFGVDTIFKFFAKTKILRR